MSLVRKWRQTYTVKISVKKVIIKIFVAFLAICFFPFELYTSKKNVYTSKKNIWTIKQFFHIFAIIFLIDFNIFVIYEKWFCSPVPWDCSGKHFFLTLYLWMKTTFYLECHGATILKHFQFFWGMVFSNFISRPYLFSS